MNESACQGRPMLGRCTQTACQLVFEMGDSTEIEHRARSLLSDVSVRAADSKERHGNVFSDRKGGQQTGVVKEKAAESIAASLDIFFSQRSYALPVDTE